MPVLDASRIYDWTSGVTTGVHGGIPTDRVVYQTLDLDDTGETDVSLSIWEAISACPAGQVVVLPETSVGLKVSTQFRLNNETTLRGAGRALTTLLYHGTTGGRVLACGSGQTEPGVNGDYSGGVAILAGIKGEYTIEVADGSGFAQWDTIIISENNDYTIPFVQPNGGQERLRRKKHQVEAVNGNTITLREPLMWTLSTSLLPTARKISFSGTSGNYKCGFEGFTLDCSPYGGNFSNGALGMWQSVECWVKDVYVKAGGANAAILEDCFRCELQGYKCDQTGTTAGHTGLILNRSCGSLVTNGQFGAFIEVNFASGGSSICYNYFHCANAGEFTGFSIVMNHGGGSQYVLAEGNWGDKFICDGYHGNGFGFTIHRNVIRGKNETSSQWEWCVGLFRFNRNTNIVGNILGRGHSWTAYDNNNQCSPNITYTMPMIYMLGLPNMGGPGADPTLAPPWSDGMPPDGLAWPGRAFYQEVDKGVKETVIRKGNYNGFDNGIPASESLGVETLEDSYAYPSGAPSWWGAFPWPPYDPESPEDDGPERIPAGSTGSVEFVATPSFSPLASGSPFDEPQTVTITCETPGATIHYILDETTLTEASPVYSSPILIEETTTLKAFAVKSGLEDSAVRTGVYTIVPEGQHPPPVIDPPGGSFTVPVNITITLS